MFTWLELHCVFRPGTRPSDVLSAETNLFDWAAGFGKDQRL